MLQRAIDWNKIKTLYKQRQVKAYHLPLPDDIEDELCANLFVGAQHLNNMINK